MQLRQPFAERSAVAEIAAGNDDVVRCLPPQLFHYLEHDGLLSLEAKWIDRVQEVQRVICISQQPLERDIEVAIDVNDLRAKIQRLRQLVHRHVSCRQVDQRTQSRTRCVSCK